MPSPAQHPPEVVLECIFRFLNFDSIGSSSTAGLGTGNWATWPITRVCQAWRQVGLSFAYENAVFRSGFKSNIPLVNSIGAADRVKGVTLMFDTEAVFHGSALSQLTSPPLHSSVFRFATRLNICLSGNLPTIAGGVKRFTENAQKLCSGIQRMVPSAMHAGVIHSWRSNNGNWPTYASVLLNEIFAGKTAIDTVDAGTNAVPNLFAGSVRLQRIIASHPPSSPHFLAVVCRNAETLQTLDIRLEEPAEAISLIVGGNGSCIYYPHLHSLTLASTSSSTTLVDSSLSTLARAPFPALQKLALHMPYPFVDDALLRGSERSLEVLDMRIDDRTLGTFSQCGVFDKGRFGVLDIIKLSNWAFKLDWVTVPNGRQLFGAFCAASVVSFTRLFRLSFDSIQPYLGDYSQTLQVLDTDNLNCTLDQLVVLIESLPFLRSLSATCRRSAILEHNADSTHADCTSLCRVRTVDKYIDTVFTHPKVQFMESHIGFACEGMGEAAMQTMSRPPISKSLLDTRVYLEPGSSSMQRIRLAVVLAILCPSIRSFGSITGAVGAFVTRSTFVSDPPFMELLGRTKSSTSDN